MQQVQRYDEKKQAYALTHDMMYDLMNAVEDQQVHQQVPAFGGSRLLQLLMKALWSISFYCCFRSKEAIELKFRQLTKKTWQGDLTYDYYVIRPECRKTGIE